MSRLDYRRKKQRELERQERGEAGWREFVKRHLGLLVLAVIVVLVSAAALIAALTPILAARCSDRTAQSCISMKIRFLRCLLRLGKKR